MAFWSSGNRTHSPRSDVDMDNGSADDSDDRTPSPYSDEDSGPPWVDTPLIHSRPISKRLGPDVYLKMEHLQPSQSYKYRGVSNFVQQAKEKYGSNLHVIAASSGNGALAAACASKDLFVKCTVFVTKDVSQEIIERLKREEAKVIVGGDSQGKALKKAKAAVEGNPHAILVPAYDDQVLWNGYSTMISEMRNKLDFIPDVIFCSVGGGGLLGGIIRGCAASWWDHVTIVAIEPVGSNAFYSSVSIDTPWKEMYQLDTVEGVAADMEIVGKEPDTRIAYLRNHKTRVKSLVAPWPPKKVLDQASMRTGRVISVCVPDEMIMSAAISFADEHKILTELGCAAALTPAYEPNLMRYLREVIPAENGLRNAVFILRGGIQISLAEMEEFKGILRRDLEAGKTSWECFCDGIQVTVEKSKIGGV